MPSHLFSGYFQTSWRPRRARAWSPQYRIGIAIISIYQVRRVKRWNNPLLPPRPAQLFLFLLERVLHEGAV